MTTSLIQDILVAGQFQVSLVVLLGSEVFHGRSILFVQEGQDAIGVLFIGTAIRDPNLELEVHEEHGELAIAEILIVNREDRICSSS